MNQSTYIVRLLRKYLDESINEQERGALAAWAAQRPENQRLLERLHNDERLIADLELYWDLWQNEDAQDREQRILDAVDKKRGLRKGFSLNRLRQWIPYAAALLLVSGIGIAYWNSGQESKRQVETLQAEDILPGGNRATLSLPDGSSIDLNDAQSGIIVGDQITYLDGSRVDARVSRSAGASKQAEMLVLKTPVGGNYRVVLPDGSEVWLNANTTLTYPAHFDPSERIVRLEGEAYFDVQRVHRNGNDIPFKVISNGQTVHVLGTEFNISAYSEEAQIKTTLVDGLIEVVNQASRNRQRVSPGQQAVVEGTRSQINAVDVTKSIAWKNGRFSFDGKSFGQIMREMARWYNLSIEYQGGVPTDQFIGDAYKTDKLGTVLRFLESSNIEYRVEPGDNHTYKLIIDNTGRRKEATAN